MRSCWDARASLGAELRRSETQCGPHNSPAAGQLSDAPPSGSSPGQPNRPDPCRMRFGRGMLGATGMTLAQLVGMGLSRVVGRDVIDRARIERPTPDSPCRAPSYPRHADTPACPPLAPRNAVHECAKPVVLLGPSLAWNAVRALMDPQVGCPFAEVISEMPPAGSVVGIVDSVFHHAVEGERVGRSRCRNRELTLC